MASWTTSGGEKVLVDINDGFFDQILRSPGVEGLCKQKAQEAMAIAKANAPVKSGAYRDGIELETVERQHRRTYMVVATAEHSLLVETQTQNLAKALKAVRS